MEPPFLGGLAPSYDGGGLYNVPQTILRTFGAEAGQGVAALDPEVLRGVERVLLVLVDGLGMEQLREVLSRESLALGDAGKEGQLLEITSVAPTTTTAALATVCTAASPWEHGLVGYRLLLKDLGVLANMIRFGPVIGGGRFEARGVDPKGFLGVPTVFERLKAVGVPSVIVTRKDYLGSALSKMTHGGGEVLGYGSISDCLVQARRALAGGRRFVYAYWDLLDSLAHRYGALTEEYGAELALIDGALDREVFSREGDGRTLVLLTADHGHINVAPERRVDLRGHPELLDSLVLPPAGEPRYSYLYAKPGRAEAVLDYLRAHFPADAAAFPAEEAAARGYFGPGKAHPASRERLGDIHLTPTGDKAFIFPFPGEKGDLIGRHGGFTRAEMAVPLLAVRR